MSPIIEDRVPTYPGRRRLIPVEGQPNIYDVFMADEPIVEGFPASRAAFNMVAPWALLTEYNTPGTVSFTVPEGVYEIGVFIIGAGGSGCASKLSSSNRVSGGAAGYTRSAIMKVTAGQILSGVVGQGGAAVTTNTTSTTIAGNNGSSSSFGGLVAEGGKGGGPFSNSTLDVAGGQGPAILANHSNLDAINAPAMGMVLGRNRTYSSRPADSLNPFNLMRYLAAGGWAIGETGNISSQTAVTVDDGGKGGNGAGSITASVKGQDATGKGNGGGGAAVSANFSAGTATSGAGANGAVLIYIRRAV